MTDKERNIIWLNAKNMFNVLADKKDRKLREKYFDELVKSKNLYKMYKVVNEEYIHYCINKRNDNKMYHNMLVMLNRINYNKNIDIFDRIDEIMPL